MTVESATYIDELVPGNTGDNSLIEEIGAQVALVKTVLQNSLPLVSGAVSATDVQLNYLAITTLGTAQASKALTADASANVNASALTWTDLGTVTTVDVTAMTLGGSASLTAVDTDISTVSASDDTLASAKAIKTYVDSAVAAASFYTLHAILADVSTAETVWVVAPAAGTIVRVDSVLEGAITVADATVTVTTSADAAIATLVVTQSGSAAGDVDSTTSITNATVTAGQALKVKTDGGSTTAQRVWVFVLVQND